MRILIENTKYFYQQRCWKSLMHLYNYNKRFAKFPDMKYKNKIKRELSVLGVLNSPCYINRKSKEIIISNPLLR